ncbi:MAG: 3-keto-5-aminohexanoate cleavage protein, partial [Candidatus Calescibacterium sp.]
WQVIGISREQWPLVMQSVLLGGHARVGYEDNFYLPNGEMAKSNGELVEAAARIIREVGKEVATPEEARKILKLEEARKLAQAK